MANTPESSAAGSEAAPLRAAPPTAALDLMQRLVQGAHDGIDKLADRAAPTVMQVGQTLADTEQALQAKADQARDTGQQWTDSLRRTVRGSPLFSVAAALALGALVARITR